MEFAKLFKDPFDTPELSFNFTADDIYSKMSKKLLDKINDTIFFELKKSVA